MGCIYKETNTISETGKCYIGQSKRDGKDRDRKHRNGNGGAKLLDRAVALYGKDAFVQEILHDGVLDITISTPKGPMTYLSYLERAEIKKHNCQDPNGYNIHPGGNVPPSWKGKKHSAEACRNMSKAKTSPNKEPARQLFFSLPDSMSLAEKRKHLREKRKILIDTFPEMHRRTIWRWTKEWIGEQREHHPLTGSS